jgi:hypothetical protein
MKNVLWSPVFTAKDLPAVVELLSSNTVKIFKAVMNFFLKVI